MTVPRFVTFLQAALVAILALNTALTHATPIGHNSSSINVSPIPLHPVVGPTLDAAAYRQLIDGAVSRVQHTYPGAYWSSITCWGNDFGFILSPSQTKIIDLSFTLLPFTQVLTEGQFNSVGDITWVDTTGPGDTELPVTWPPRIDMFDAMRDVTNYTYRHLGITGYVDYRVQSFTDFGNLEVYEFADYDDFGNFHQYHIRADNERLMEGLVPVVPPSLFKTNATRRYISPLNAAGVLRFPSKTNVTGGYILPLGNFTSNGVNDA